MLRPHSGRRRSRYAPQLCAAAAAVLLLFSLSVLHSRLSSSSSSSFRLGLGFRSVLTQHSDTSNPDQLFNDADNDAFDGSAEDRIDELDDLNEQNEKQFTEDDDINSATGLDDDPDSDELELVRNPSSGYFWDHTTGVTRQSFGKQDQHPSDHIFTSDTPLDELRPDKMIKITFGSDDQPVDEDVRLKLDSIRRIEDALMLKVGGGNSPLREGWVWWLESKADFLRRDRMLRSNLELLNPKNHPLLQDPDMPGLTSLTRGDRLMQKVILKELQRTPFQGGGGENREIKRAELRKTLHLEEKKKLQVVPEGGSTKRASKETRKDNADGRRWGYFPGLEPHLMFSEFMDRFLGSGLCTTRVFMVWNSPPWMYGVRHQRGLESLLYHHRTACVVVFSETMELDFFKDFVKEGFKIAVAMPNLDELLKDTPAHVFASVWFEWRKTKYYSIHYSELLRLAALYKYGGVYLDTDIIVLKTLHSLENSVGIEDRIGGSSIFNGAVMAFKRKSPFLLECLREYYSTYDDTQLRWNGADLMTRVINRLYGKEGDDKLSGQLGIKIEPPTAFFPISYSNITRYFVASGEENERAEHDVLLSRILNESITFHFWNELTSALVPEPDSLVDRLLNRYCLNCMDVL